MSENTAHMSGPESLLASGGTHSTHYLGCILDRILTLDVLGTPGDEYLQLHTRRHVDLLTCLTNLHDERLTYDLRIIAHPDSHQVSRGRIMVALLCRVDGISSDEAGRYAHSLLHLLQALFDEYVFRLATPAEIKALLDPFPVRHLVEISRRAGMERLDTLKIGRPPKRLGFIQLVESSSPKETPVHRAGSTFPDRPDALFHVFPYLPTAAPFTTLCKLLLSESHPVAISCRLRPTTLTPEEEAFLEEQIAHCECAARAELRGLPDDLSSLRPTLREQAQMYQRYQARMLFGLKDNAGVLRLEIASPERLPLPVIDTVGALITGPAGGTDGTLDASYRYLAGGYEVHERSADTEGISAFRQLDFVPDSHPDAPREAQRLPHLFDAVEATAAFRLPPATREIPPGLEAQVWRTRPAPRELPDEGCLIGISQDRGTRQPVRIGRDDRRRHVYLVGQTGTGKTTLLKTMIVDDIRAGEGVCVIDPHGDLFHELLGLIPEERLGDVVILDPTDMEHPVGLNMLENHGETQQHFLVQELVGIIMRLMEDEFGPSAAGQFAGPMFLQHMRMNLLLAMSNPADPGTLLEFYTIFQEKDYWKRWLPLKMSDPLLERWVAGVLPKTDYLKQGSDTGSMGSYVGSKFEGFVFDPMLRRIFGQKRSTIDLREIMDSGKILLVNLAKGELTEVNSRFLGMVLLAKLQAAAMGRGQIPRDQRRDFAVYVDEFQSIATQNFVTLLSEARKFGLNLVLANQFVSQIKDTRIADAIFGNVGTLIAFRLGQVDAEIIEKELFPVFTRFDLVNLPNRHAYIATLINGQAVQPFSIGTVIDPSPNDEARALAVRQHSRAAYGRSKTIVDAEISMSLQASASDTIEPHDRK